MEVQSQKEFLLNFSVLPTHTVCHIHFKVDAKYKL